MLLNVAIPGSFFKRAYTSAGFVPTVLSTYFGSTSLPLFRKRLVTRPVALMGLRFTSTRCVVYPSAAGPADDRGNTDVEGFPEGSRMRSRERQVVVGRAYPLAGSLSGGRTLS